MNRLFLLFVLLTLSAAGCKKKSGIIVINGVITNPANNNGVSGVDVNFYIQQPTSGTFSSGYSFVETTQTNSRGEFVFEIKNSNASSFKFVCEGNGYYPIEKAYNAGDFLPDKENLVQMEMLAKGFLRVKIKNTSPFSANDKLVFQIEKGAPNVEGFCLSTSQTFTGENVDTEINCNSYGEQKMVFLWFVTKQNSTKSYSDSLTVPFNDTAIFELNY
jgi:hypothetical protein